MIDLLISPLGPALVLAAVGALLRLLRRPTQPRALLWLALAGFVVAALLLLRLRTVSVPDLQAFWWPLVLPPQRLRWAVDGWNWLALLLLLLSGVGALLLTWTRPGWRTGAFHGLSLVLLGSAALSVVSDNLLTLSGAWVVTDALLVARARGGRPTGGDVPISLVASGSLLVLLAISITSLPVATTTLAAVELPAETLALLLLAAALRMAAYPFHLWLRPGGAARTVGAQLLIGGVALVTGGWLLGRLYTIGAAFWLAHPVWRPLLATCVLGAGVTAWASDEQERFVLLVSSRASWLWLTLALATSSLGGRDVLGWSLLTAVAGLMLFAIGQAIRESWGWRLPLALSAAVLAGAPLTAGFPSRALASADALPVWGLSVLAEALVISCVLAAWRQPAPIGPDAQPDAADFTLSGRTIRLLLAFGVVAVPVVLLGLQPGLLADLAGFGSGLGLGSLLGGAGLGQWIGIILSLALGAALAGAARRPEADLRRWRPRLARFTSLTWVLAMLRGLMVWIESGWRMILTVFEGEGYLGWLALLTLLAWLIVRP